MDYASNHPVKKGSGGVSSARYSGIEKVAGKYLMFVDADDCIAYGYRFVRSDSPMNTESLII